jgi:hypothetical protein
MKTVSGFAKGGLAAVIALVLAGSLGMTGCTPSGGGGGVTLEGTWAGNVTYTASLVVAGSPPSGDNPFEKAFTVVFDAQGQPDTLDLVVDVNKVVLLSTAKLIDVGDTDTQTFQAGTSSTVVTATVKAVSRSDTAFSITLDPLVVEFTGTGSMTGTYTIEGAIQSDSSLKWQGAGDYKIPIGDANIDLQVTGDAALIKQ